MLYNAATNNDQFSNVIQHQALFGACMLNNETCNAVTRSVLAY